MNATAAPKGEERRCIERLTTAFCFSAAALGVTLQFVQDEDPRFPLAYFTILAAILLSISILALWRSPGSARAAAALRAAQAGVLLSSFVYWGLIAPVNGVGSTLGTQLANVTLHGLLPITVFAYNFTVPERRTATLGQLAATLWFPMAYVAGSVLMQLSGHAAVYEFLDWRTQRGLTVAGILGMGVTYLALGAVLAATSGLLGARWRDA